MVNDDDWLIEKIHVSFSLQNLFLNIPIGLKIVSFLKPSDLRVLILLLQYKNFPVNIYFERLCHVFLNVTEIDELLKHYIPLENAGDSPTIKTTLLKKSCTLLNTNGLHMSLFSTFQSSIFTKNVSCLPYTLLYKAELWNRYCDECYSFLHEAYDPQICQRMTLPCCASDWTVKGSLPFYDQATQTSVANDLAQMHKTNSVTLDLQLAQSVLCDACHTHFSSRESLQSILKKLYQNGINFKGVCMLKNIKTITFRYDHGGIFASNYEWKKFYTFFHDATVELRKLYKQGFSKRMARKFGQCFYHQFIYKILPCNRFLEIDAKQKTYNPVPWVTSTSSSLGKRKSRFKNGPTIDRYPLGSVERSTAYMIASDFNIWSTTESLQELIALESYFVDVFNLASNILHHPDYMKAASMVEDYILTREIDRETFDKIYLASLWRVLHRGKSRRLRRFTCCIYDRHRIDKFFSKCCTSAMPPVLSVKGYLGFDSQETTVD